MKSGGYRRPPVNSRPNPALGTGVPNTLRLYTRTYQPGVSGNARFSATVENQALHVWGFRYANTTQALIGSSLACSRACALRLRGK